MMRFSRLFLPSVLAAISPAALAQMPDRTDPALFTCADFLGAGTPVARARAERMVYWATGHVGGGLAASGMDTMGFEDLAVEVTRALFALCPGDPALSIATLAERIARDRPMRGTDATETVSCTDETGEIEFSYDIAPRAIPPISAVTMQLTGDFGLSTLPTHRSHDNEYVAAGFSGDGVEGGEIGWRDAEGHEHSAMSFRIGRVHGARLLHMAGAVWVEGGGLWTVTCVTDDGEGR